MTKCCWRSRFLVYKRKTKPFYILNNPPRHDDLDVEKKASMGSYLMAAKETWPAGVVVFRYYSCHLSLPPAGCTGTGSGEFGEPPPPSTPAADFKSSLHSNQHQPHQQGKLPWHETVGLECHSPIRCFPSRRDKAASPTCFSLSLSPPFLSAKCHDSCTHRSANKRQPKPGRTRWCIVSCGGRR